MNYQRIITHKLFTPIAVGAVSLGAGAAAGYYFTKKYFLERVEEVETTVTIVETVEFDQDEHDADLIEAFKNSDFVPEEPAWKCNDTVRADFVLEEPKEVRELRLIEDVVKEEFNAVEVNVFTDVVEGWNYEDELKTRTSDAPYIIHQDEFYDDEMGYDNQQALTWYDKDKILATHDDSVVYNPYVMIGDNLRFGHGSRDPDVVFIRNEKLHSEYEVTRLPGSYEEVVVGSFEERLAADDLRHSRAPGKFPRQE